jgi:hypothetical protein
MKNKEKSKKNSHCNQFNSQNQIFQLCQDYLTFGKLAKHLGNLIETQVLSKWKISTLGYS